MNPQKKMPNKTELLLWLNQTLKQSGLSFSRIQQLGTGVGYLALMSCLHPWVVQGIKYNKKPNNEYEYHQNLKMLASAFARLGIQKHLDIQKLAKLKMQDNLALLQWFYAYAQDLPRNQPHPEKQVALPPQRKVKIKPSDKLNFNLPNKSAKMDIESTNYEVDLKTVNSATKRIFQIEQIIHCEQIPNSEDKLGRIISILNLRDNNNSITTPSRHNKRQMAHDENIREENLQKQKDKNGYPNEQAISVGKDISYVKCRKLQEKYEECLKNSILKKESFVKDENKPRQSVRLALNHQTFEYEQPKNDERLTDNSILLQSDRRSMQSETNLLHDV